MSKESIFTGLNEFSAYTVKDVQYHDTFGLNEKIFYHGILLVIFGHLDGWKIMSNAESGEGYSDINGIAGSFMNQIGISFLLRL